MKTISRKIFIIIVASSLLLASFATISPSLAKDDDKSKWDRSDWADWLKGRRGWTVSGSASLVSIIPCLVDPDVDCIENQYIDVDGDGIDDLLMTTRHMTTTYSGVLNGQAFSLQTITQNLTSNIAYSTFTITFTGTVGDSEPGTMSMIGNLESDRSQAPDFYQWWGTHRVIEGSGFNGLESICGGGSYTGNGPPFVTESNYEFRFGKKCK